MLKHNWRSDIFNKVASQHLATLLKLRSPQVLFIFCNRTNGPILPNAPLQDSLYQYHHETRFLCFM